MKTSQEKMIERIEANRFRRVLRGRAARARRQLDLEQEFTAEAIQTAVLDLLVDILHLADRAAEKRTAMEKNAFAVDLEDLVRRAHTIYATEGDILYKASPPPPG